jgi:Skp family chaperone for outer membrane proteins
MSRQADLCIYQKDIGLFISDGGSVFSEIVKKGETLNPNFQQICAWDVEIQSLQETLKKCGAVGQIIFEYDMSRLGDRIDVVLLLSKVVFSMEFKTGEQTPSPVSRKQANRYASDLKNFHELSRNLYICPILIIPSDDSLKGEDESAVMRDEVFPLQVVNNQTLGHTLNRIQSMSNRNDVIDDKFARDWINSSYQPAPNIVEAVEYLRKNRAISDRAFRTDSHDQNIVTCSSKIDQIIANAQKKPGSKTIIFVAGVPGAGKTVVGINAVFSHFSKEVKTAFVSGNGPLIQVLKASLLDQAKDDLRNKRFAELKVEKPEMDGKEISAMMDTDTELLRRISDEEKAIKWQMVEFKKYKEEVYRQSKYIEDNVLVFDEAQRAWTAERMIKKGDKKDRPEVIEGDNGLIMKMPTDKDSEPLFLMRAMSLSEDWRVVIALVGIGQHINSGETGINEWLSAFGPEFRNWDIYMPEKLLTQKVDPVSETAKERLSTMGDHLHFGRDCDNLYMGESLRNVRGSSLSQFVDGVIDGDGPSAKKNLEILQQGGYRIFITRNLQAAKKYIRYDCCSGEGERCGIIASSNALRLKVDGLFVNDRDFKTVDWFLAEPSSFKSSNFLEKVASEFDVEGLELDWSLMGWDLDMRRENGQWKQYSIAYHDDWTQQDGLKAEYIKNTYRVLLTRSRQGFVIFVPDTSEDVDPTNNKDMDFTRPHKSYQEIFRFLHEDCGIPTLPIKN